MNWIKVWHIIRWPLLVLILLYVAGVIWRIPHAMEAQKTEETVAKIHAQKITLDDVMGKNLPPPPDKAQVDATIAGLDVNNNGIRDDVEWAIFNRYPDSPKIRAAELQYAKALQTELVDVFNSDTLIAAIQQEAHALSCLDTLHLDSLTDEVKVSVLNTETRKTKREEIFNKYMKSFSLEIGPHCQIDLLQL